MSRLGRLRGTGFSLAFLLTFVAPLAAEEGVWVRSIGAAPAPVAALLARGGEGGSLRIATTALPLSYGAEAVELLLVVELDGAAILARHPGGRLGLELHAYAVAGDGAVRAALSEGVAIDLRRHGEAVERDGVRWTGILRIPPEQITVRIFVRERAGGEFALREQSLELAPPDRGAPVFLAAAAPSPDAWLDARSPTLTESSLAAVAAVGGAPAALPVLPAGGRCRILAWFGGGTPVPVEASLIDPRGETAGRLELEPARRVDAGAGVEVAIYEGLLPAESGVFELRLEADGGRPASQPSRVVLRAGDRPTNWNRIGRIDLDAASAEARSRRAREVLPSKEERGRIERSLLEGWSRYARGQRSDAIAAREAFDAALLAETRRRAEPLLEAIELPLLVRLLHKDRECLVPLLTFYGDLIGAHLASGRLGLSRRAELVAEDLLERFVAGEGSEEERALAAATIESVAAELIAAGASERAARLVRRSTELVPARAGSWLALARLEEMADQPKPARSALERVLELEPGNREARLRRARLDARVGSTARAEDTLVGLLEEPVVDWVGVVAAQERTRSLLAAGRSPEAAKELATLVRRWPGEPSLWLALGYAAERSGDRETSTMALARAVTADRGYAVAPRRRYAEPPLEALRRDRTRVETAALLRLDALSRALAALETR